jgi:hypothetical protein
LRDTSITLPHTRLGEAIGVESNIAGHRVGVDFAAVARGEDDHNDQQQPAPVRCRDCDSQTRQRACQRRTNRSRAQESQRRQSRRCAHTGSRPSQIDDRTLPVNQPQHRRHCTERQPCASQRVRCSAQRDNQHPPDDQSNQRRNSAECEAWRIEPCAADSQPKERRHDRQSARACEPCLPQCDPQDKSCDRPAEDRTPGRQCRSGFDRDNHGRQRRSNGAAVAGWRDRRTVDLNLMIAGHIGGRRDQDAVYCPGLAHRQRRDLPTG